MATKQGFKTPIQQKSDDKNRPPGWEEYYAPESGDDDQRQSDDKNPYIDVDEPQMRNLTYRPFQFLEF